MDTKNTIILLILLISILGLLIGVYCSEDIDSENVHNDKWEKIYEDTDDIVTITLQKKEIQGLDNNIT